jgi:hypothetical protein
LYWSASTFENGKKGMGYAITKILERLELRNLVSNLKIWPNGRKNLKGYSERRRRTWIQIVGLIVKILENSSGDVIKEATASI